MINLTPEMIEKAKEAKSAEELLALAKKNDVEMTEEEAKAYYLQLNPPSGELDDDDLDNVAGGGCGGKKESKPSKPQVPSSVVAYCYGCYATVEVAPRKDTEGDIDGYFAPCPKCGHVIMHLEDRF